MEFFIVFSVLAFIIWVVRGITNAIVKALSKNKKPKTGSLVVSDDVKKKTSSTAAGKPKDPKPLINEAVRVYLHEPQFRGWRCPNCECENENSSTNCCVCNHNR